MEPYVTKRERVHYNNYTVLISLPSEFLLSLFNDSVLVRRSPDPFLIAIAGCTDYSSTRFKVCFSHSIHVIVVLEVNTCESVMC